MPAFPKPNPTETDPVASPTAAAAGIAAAAAQSTADSAASAASAAQSTADSAVTAAGLKLAKASNLSDVASVSAARTNLGLGSAATTAASAYATSAQGATADSALALAGTKAAKASNLSDLASASSARTNLGLGTSATLDVDTTTTLGTSDTKVPSQKAVKTYVDGATPADASTSTKGIAKASVAPVLASAPIFVGDNDPRVSAHPFQRATGYYYQPPGYDVTQHLAQGLGRGNVFSNEVAMPFPVGNSCTALSLTVRVSTGQAGTTVRLGIRQNNNGVPGTLLLDAGTVASTSNGTVQTVTFSQALTPGSYWLTATCQGSGTAPTLDNMAPNGALLVPNSSNPGLYGAGNAGFYATGVTGSLPGTFTPAGIVATEIVRIIVGF